MILLMSVLFWLAIVVAVEACTEVIVSSSIFFTIRDWFSRPAPEPECKHPIEASNNPTSGFGTDCCKKSWLTRFGWWMRHKIGMLVNCGYCSSVWVAAIASYCTGYTSFWMFAVKALVIHRVSNLMHELFARWFGRSPFSVVVTHINKGE